MRNIKMTLEYDGTDFHGWQIQPGERTVQGCMEEALSEITREEIHVTGSGRTDAGVHARGQVCNCFTGTRLSNDELHRALNSVLPNDVVIRGLEDVGDDFHARRHAVRRVYRYVITPERQAVGRRYMWFFPHPLNVEAMNRAAEILRGKHDCSAFQSVGSDEDNPVCEIYESRWEPRNGNLDFVIAANRFLRKMVRAIVGTMVEIGLEKRSFGEMAEILESRNRAMAGATAPPHGLFLEAVLYRP